MTQSRGNQSGGIRESEKRILTFGGIVVDRSQWPLVVITFPQRDIEDDELIAYLADVEAGLGARKTAYAAVVDIGSRPHLNAHQRKIQADWLNRNRDQFAKWLRAYAFVITDHVPRVLLRAVFWVAPPPVPYRLFSDREEAIAWAAKSLNDDPA